MRANALGPAAWAKLLASCETGADTVQDGLLEELRPAAARVLDAWPADLPTGLPSSQLTNYSNLYGEVLGIVPAGSHDVERDALGGFLADPRQTFEFGNQPRKRFGEVRHFL